MKLLHSMKYPALVGLLLFPLFFVNVHESHNWGDDFAQYLIQARNLLEDRPQEDNGLVYDPATVPFALPAYPAGFPLLLAGTWMCAGFSFAAFKIMISVFLFALGILTFLYLKKTASPPVSILLTCMIFFNPWTLDFKSDILSEIPFSFFLLLSILFFKSPVDKPGWYLLTGIFLGIAVSVRVTGIVFLITVLFYLLFAAWNSFGSKRHLTEPRKLLIKYTLIISSGILTWLLLNRVLTKVPGNEILTFYADAVRDKNIFQWFLENAGYYFRVVQSFFWTLGGSLSIISICMGYIFLFMMTGGMILTFLRKPEFEDVFTVLWLLLILFYPYSGGGFRFLFPVIPFLFKYFFVSIRFVADRLKIKSSVPVFAFLLIPFLSFLPAIYGQVKQGRKGEKGPMTPESQQIFQYVRENLPEDAVVAFKRPRALALFTDRRTTASVYNMTSEEIKASLDRVGAHYFLLCVDTEVDDPVLKKFVSANDEHLRVLLRNDSFTLYTDLLK